MEARKSFRFYEETVLYGGSRKGGSVFPRFPTSIWKSCQLCSERSVCSPRKKTGGPLLWKTRSQKRRTRLWRELDTPQKNKNGWLQTSAEPPRSSGLRLRWSRCHKKLCRRFHLAGVALCDIPYVSEGMCAHLILVAPTWASSLWFAFGFVGFSFLFRMVSKIGPCDANEWFLSKSRDVSVTWGKDSSIQIVALEEVCLGKKKRTALVGCAQKQCVCAGSSAQKVGEGSVSVVFWVWTWRRRGST